MAEMPKIRFAPKGAWGSSARMILGEKFFEHQGDDASPAGVAVHVVVSCVALRLCEELKGADLACSGRSNSLAPKRWSCRCRPAWRTSERSRRRRSRFVRPACTSGPWSRPDIPAAECPPSSAAWPRWARQSCRHFRIRFFSEWIQRTLLDSGSPKRVSEKGCARPAWIQGRRGPQDQGQGGLSEIVNVVCHP